MIEWEFIKGIMRGVIIAYFPVHCIICMYLLKKYVLEDWDERKTQTI